MKTLYGVAIWPAQCNPHEKMVLSPGFLAVPAGLIGTHSASACHRGMAGATAAHQEGQHTFSQCGICFLQRAFSRTYGQTCYHTSSDRIILFGPEGPL